MESITESLLEHVGVWPSRLFCPNKNEKKTYVHFSFIIMDISDTLGFHSIRDELCQPH